MKKINSLGIILVSALSLFACESEQPQVVIPEPNDDIVINEPEFEDNDEEIIFGSDLVVEEPNRHEDYYLYAIGNTVDWPCIDDEYVISGTLTWLDPKTGIFGAIAHVSEGLRFNEDIYDTSVTDIVTIDATTEQDEFTDYGQTIETWTNFDFVIGYGTHSGMYGAYGRYTSEGGWVDNLYEVGWKDEVHVGPAFFLSEAPVFSDDAIYGFHIEITEVYDDCFDFIIVDEYMLENNIGIAFGMSGSPIIQDDKIIGGLKAYYVTEDDVEIYGCGTYVEDMLIEAGIID